MGDAQDEPVNRLEITQAADVGMGSFYNHFESKDELFEAAVADRVTEDMLRLFGLPADEAYEVGHRPLPGIDEVTLPNSA